MFETGVVPYRGSSRRVDRGMLIIAPELKTIRDIFSIFFNMKVYCVLSLESPHQGDSNENTKYTIFNIKKKITLNYLKYAAIGFFPRDLKMSF